MRQLCDNQGSNPSKKLILNRALDNHVFKSLCMIPVMEISEYLIGICMYRYTTI